MESLSPNAKKVQEAHALLGCESQVVEHSETTRTAQEAAERAGCELGQIVKSLIFRRRFSGKAILVLTSGMNRVDEQLLGKHLQEPIDRPDADFVRMATGFPIGGVPPVAHSTPMETYIDEDLLQFPKVWAAAGTPNAIFEISPSELVRITAAKVIGVKNG